MKVYQLETRTKKEVKVVKTITTRDNVKSKISDTKSRGPKDKQKILIKLETIKRLNRDTRKNFK